jgi:hypothetical protein
VADKLPPPGLDYVPAEPVDGNSYGAAARSYGASINTAHSVVMRRLFPVDRPTGTGGPWVPTCYRHEVLLPVKAPDACSAPDHLCDLFESQARERLYSLAVIMTLRFEHTGLAHEAWELHRAFARSEFVRKRNLPVVLAMHIPQLSFRFNAPHTHLVIFGRRLLGSHFADFAADLFADDASIACADAFRTFATAFE